MRIHHTSITGIEKTGAFVSDFEGSVLKSGMFEFLESQIAISISEIQRIVETSHLTKGLRLRGRQTRFVCVLKAKPKGETADAADATDSENNDSENSEADDPYFCATIDSNGWKLLKNILNTLNKDTHEVFSHV